MEHSFGNFLKERRQEKKLTQKELAKLLFVSESTISKWEKDIAHPDITLLTKLSELLGVSEHELITASIDNKAREEKGQAKKWRTLSFTWSLFFYISYVVALIPCFICDLAINRGLTWFWIVLSALLLSFTFTNLPKLIKKHKLIFFPLCMYLALCVLLGVCCIYTNGTWFWVAILSVLLGLIIIFIPIYIAKYRVFSKVKKYNDFISVGIDFVMLNVLLVVINAYTIANGYNESWWYFCIALPIVCVVYFALNILLSVRFLKINKLLRTCIVLLLSDLFLYLPPLFLKSNDPSIQQGIDEVNILKANLSNWNINGSLENNIHLIIFLTTLAVAIAFLSAGLIRYFRKKQI